MYENGGVHVCVHDAYMHAHININIDTNIFKSKK